MRSRLLIPLLITVALWAVVRLIGVDRVAAQIPAGTVNVNAKATNAAPVYVEGAWSPLSVDLAGRLRVVP